MMSRKILFSAFHNSVVSTKLFSLSSRQLQYAPFPKIKRSDAAMIGHQVFKGEILGVGNANKEFLPENFFFENNLLNLPLAMC